MFQQRTCEGENLGENHVNVTLEYSNDLNMPLIQEEMFAFIYVAKNKSVISFKWVKYYVGLYTSSDPVPISLKLQLLIAIDKFAK